MVATSNKKIRFCNNNQVTGLDSANITVSSALASFPASNFQSNARFRTWKPAGNFTVDSTNKTIYVNDGGDVTVSLTEASYTYSTLATHIASAINAASANNNWTCTYSTTTRKFTIGNSSSMTLRETQTTNAAWDMLGYTDGTDHAGTSFEADESRNHTHESIIFNFGVSKAIDFFACVGLVGENLTISSNATITLKGNATNSFTSPTISKTPTHTDNGLFMFEDTDDMNYQWWEFKFIDRTNTVGPEGFTISDIYLGDYDTLTSTNLAGEFAKSLVDPTKVSKSDAGAKFFRLKSKYWNFSNTSVQHLTDAERLTLQDFFQSHGISSPFYVSIDPTQVVSNSIDELTKYVQFEGSPKFTHVIRDLYNMSFAMSEVV